MEDKTKIIAIQKLHKGFLEVNQYEIDVKSLHPHKTHIRYKREVMLSPDSVVVLIYAPAIDSFVLCREFRSGVFLNKNGDDPFVLGCVAGMIDKSNTPDEIACMEVREETGLVVDKLVKIAMIYRSPGIMTERTYVYYAEVAGIPQIGLYGIEGEEEILTQLISRKKTCQLMDEMKIIDSTTLLALNWFRANKST